MHAVLAPIVSYHRVLKRTRIASFSFNLIFSLLFLRSTVTALIKIGSLKPLFNPQQACRRAAQQFYTHTRRTSGEKTTCVRRFNIIDRFNYHRL